jgi:sorbitol-6-phosphate 2-dehydrogenase
MREDLIGVIGPLLRGLCFDGERGSIVSWSPDEKAGKLAVSSPSLSEGPLGKAEEKAVLEALKAAFKGKNPRTADSVSYPGVGSFLLTHPKPGSSRNEVVRDKVSLVTGGAQGFGAEIVRALVASGSLVFIADMNADGAKTLAAELNAKAGCEITWPLAVNVTDEASVRSMFLEVAKKTGGLDLLVSNAGIVKAGGVMEAELKDFSFVTNVNYIGYFLGVKHAAPLMRLQNLAAGRYYSDIVQINSKSGLEGSNKNGAYAGSKFGAIGLTQSFALELIEYNIKVNSICPGNFLDGPLWSDPKKGLFVQYLESGKVPGAKTLADVRAYYEGKVPMKRGCTGEDVMRALLYIVEQKYETGQALPVTGGQVMLN